MTAKKKDKTETKSTELAVTRAPIVRFDSEENKVRLDKFLKYLRAGNYIETCCKIAGIARHTFYSWVEYARAGKEPYRSFIEQVDSATAEAIADRVGVITQAANAGDWKAAAWWLERMDREHYAMDSKVIIESKVNEQVESLIQQLQALLPEQEFAQLMGRLNDDPDEREDFVSKEVSGATDVEDAEIIDPED